MCGGGGEGHETACSQLLVAELFKALHMKNWFIDNGVPGHPLGRPGAIEVLLDRLPPIPTDLEPDDVAPALALALAIATGATASEEVA